MALSRKQMEEVIERGGSVLHKGRVITKKENLPSKAALAQTDEEKAQAAAELDEQIEKAQAQKAKIAQKTEAKAPAKQENK